MCTVGVPAVHNRPCTTVAGVVMRRGASFGLLCAAAAAFCGSSRRVRRVVGRRRRTTGAVKRAFARVIGESYVPKDWGGERSDLYTSRVFARGRQMSAAWLFKGPGHPRAMDVKALGKNGDQIDRLFTEPAELLVLQHCHQIKPSVVNMMDAYAHDVRRPRSYMIIDGADTGRILRSLGLLPADPPLQEGGTGAPRH